MSRSKSPRGHRRRGHGSEWPKSQSSRGPPRRGDATHRSRSNGRTRERDISDSDEDAPSSRRNRSESNTKPREDTWKGFPNQPLPAPKTSRPLATNQRAHQTTSAQHSRTTGDPTEDGRPNWRQHEVVRAMGSSNVHTEGQEGLTVLYYLATSMVVGSDYPTLYAAARCVNCSPFFRPPNPPRCRLQQLVPDTGA
jgi:hypothetical protein